MTKQPGAIAWISQIVMYCLFLAILLCSTQRSIHDEYVVRGGSISAKDCIEIGRKLTGLVSCPTRTEPDGTRSQKITYQASIWSDIPADRDHIQIYGEQAGAKIAKYSDWTRYSLFFFFMFVPTIEIAIFLLAVTGENRRYVNRLSRDRRMRTRLALFCKIGADYRFFMALFMFGGLVLFGLAALGWVSESELGAVPVIAFILGLGGAAYSILSKFMADKVFDQTMEINQTITSFFGGYDVITDMDKDNPKSAVGMIDKARHSLVIYTGSPLVSFYRDPPAGLLIASTLMTKIQQMQRETDKFTVKLIYYADDMEQKYLEAFVAAGGTDLIQGRTAQEWTEAYKEQKQALLDVVRRMPAGTGRLLQHKPGEEPQVRFIIQDEKAALFWILESATPAGAANDVRRSRAKAAGFSTDTWHMIAILLGVFENAEIAAGASAPSPAPPAAQAASRPRRRA